MELGLQELLSFQRQWFILIDVVIAMILGGVIGFERELKNKPAGLRTNMIIAGTSTLFVALGRVGILFYADMVPAAMVHSDPIRILQAVITGVGFLGAGVIIKSLDGGAIHNITTAATIWMSAAIGISVALKLYILAVSITIVLLIVNTLFDKLDRWIVRRRKKEKK